jgi:hypothetical protein
MPPGHFWCQWCGPLRPLRSGHIQRVRCLHLRTVYYQLPRGDVCAGALLLRPLPSRDLQRYRRRCLPVHVHSLPSGHVRDTRGGNGPYQLHFLHRGNVQRQCRSVDCNQVRAVSSGHLFCNRGRLQSGSVPPLRRGLGMPRWCRHPHAKHLQRPRRFSVHVSLPARPDPLDCVLQRGPPHFHSGESTALAAGGLFFNGNGWLDF